MKQQTFGAANFEKYGKQTRKGKFLEEMNAVIPWQELVEVVEPYYPQPQGAGRRPVGIERMLRIHFLQQWFSLSDPGVEEALYDSRAMREFVGVDLGEERAPDETTICKFRHMLERHGLGKQVFRTVNEHLKEKGLRVSTGTIVDATILHAATSTKNKARQRDPEMHSTRKGKQWYFGMKAHVGVDSRTKQIHSVVATAANVHDSQKLGELLHGRETRVWGDSAYVGQGQVIRERAPGAQDFIHRKGRRNRPLTEDERRGNRTKSHVRAKVEHVFGVMKRRFGFTRLRYKGLSKNEHYLFITCALVNMVMAKKELLRAAA